jgi:hypothetical protein
MIFDMIFEAHHVQILWCFGLGVGTWIIAWSVFPAFWLFSPLFSTKFLPCPSITNIPQCMHTSHQPYGYPPLILGSWKQSHGKPWCNSQHFCCHYAKCWFPCGMITFTCTSFNMFNSFHQRVDIVFFKNKIFILTYVVIVGPTWMHLLPQSCAI